MPASTTRFWELAGIFLSVAQMIISLERVEKYEDKLEELADVLFKCGDNCPGESLAVKHRCRYRDFRNLDAEFKKWYDSVPKYEVCESGIRRGKGYASQTVGTVMRKLSRQNNGYTPLAMVGNVSSGMINFAKTTGTIRALNHNAEMKRKMEDQIFHWAKLISIPIEQEGNYANFTGPIKLYMQSMANWGEGFNSGAYFFGNSLYGLLHSQNQNQTNYGPIPANSGSNLSGRAITIGYGLLRR